MLVRKLDVDVTVDGAYMILREGEEEEEKVFFFPPRDVEIDAPVPIPGIDRLKFTRAASKSLADKDLIRAD